MHAFRKSTYVKERNAFDRNVFPVILSGLTTKPPQVSNGGHWTFHMNS